MPGPLPRILLVDDDHMTRTAHAAILGGLHLEGGSVCDETDSAAMALELVRAAVDNKCPYVAVVVDQALLGPMDGTALCEAVALESPRTMRVMVTGDGDAHMDAVVRGQVHMFLHKPVDVASLQVALQVALAKK